MGYPFLIFILSLLWYLIPLPPVSFEPTASGLFQDYGFQQNDSERILPILNLIRTGAYKIQEEDISYFNGQGHSSKSYYQVYSRNDSVFLEEYWKPDDTLILSSRNIYRKNGKLIYFLSLSLDGSISNLEYFRSKDSMVKYRRWGGVTDTLQYTGVDAFDNAGNLIESDEVNENGYIFHKTINHYDNAGHKIDESEYWPKLKPSIRHSYAWWDDTNNFNEWRRIEDSLSSLPVILVLALKAEYKIDTSNRTIVTGYYGMDEDTLALLDRYITRYDQQWRQTVYDGEKKEFYTETKYVDDDQRHLLSKSEIRNGQVQSVEKWDYNNHGKVIQHTDRNFQTKWIYDRKGNIIESDQNLNGVLHYVQRFSISYK